MFGRKTRSFVMLLVGPAPTAGTHGATTLKADLPVVTTARGRPYAHASGHSLLAGLFLACCDRVNSVFLNICRKDDCSQYVRRRLRPCDGEGIALSWPGARARPGTREAARGHSPARCHQLFKVMKRHGKCGAVGAPLITRGRVCMVRAGVRACGGWHRDRAGLRLIAYKLALLI